MSSEPRSRVLMGCERTQAVNDHLASLAAPIFEDVRDGDSPIAIWARARRLVQAQRRARLVWGSGKNRKRFDLCDDAPRLIDEVS